MEIPPLICKNYRNTQPIGIACTCSVRGEIYTRVNSVRVIYMVFLVQKLKFQCIDGIRGLTKVLLFSSSRSLQMEKLPDPCDRLIYWPIPQHVYRGINWIPTGPTEYPVPPHCLGSSSTVVSWILADVGLTGKSSEAANNRKWKCIYAITNIFVCTWTTLTRRRGMTEI